MTEYTRALLSELMAPYQETKKRFDEDDVCKLHLVKFCPKDIFTNTKSDLGVCTKIHDDNLRKDYQSCQDKEKYNYEKAFYDSLLSIINELDRKIRKGNDRLNNKPVTAEEKQEKIIMLDEKIKYMLAQAEQAGEDGKVAEAQAITKSVEQLQTELEFVKNDEANPLFRQDKKMDVCNICGALLVTNDSARRLEAHMEGKQHTGFLRVRNALEEYQKIFGKKETTNKTTNDAYLNRRASKDRSRSPISSRSSYRDKRRDSSYRSRERSREYPRRDSRERTQHNNRNNNRHDRQSYYDRDNIPEDRREERRDRRR